MGASQIQDARIFQQIHKKIKMNNLTLIIEDIAM